MADTRSQLAAYLAQEIELGMPDPIFTQGFTTGFLTGRAESTPVKKGAIAAAVASPSATPAAGIKPPRLYEPKSTGLAALRPKPIADMARFTVARTEAALDASENKREAFKKLYYEFKLCHKCPLGKRRKHFVFGAGNVDAPLLVIGEAPGAEEDEQGLPFVGRAGKLLTDMLAAIRIDRQKDTFITNVLKCRPPENRTPELEEVSACLPLLKQQIEIMRPKAILLLGRSAAHALLERPDSIQNLREETLSYKGIPAVVTYHPAALLRTAEYKRPAWEDLKKLQTILTTLGAYGD